MFGQRNKTNWSSWNADTQVPDFGPTLPTNNYLPNYKDAYSPFGMLNSNTDIKVDPRIAAAQKIFDQEKTKKDNSKKEVLPIEATPPPPAKKRVKKEKIPATLKNILWHKYFETSLTGICQCCKVETISKAIFDAGHIISEKNGGQVILENLKPICKLCNSSMGKTNMDDFMKKYGI
jgi:hypothetical protein